MADCWDHKVLRGRLYTAMCACVRMWVCVCVCPLLPGSDLEVLLVAERYRLPPAFPRGSHSWAFQCHLVVSKRQAHRATSQLPAQPSPWPPTESLLLGTEPTHKTSNLEGWASWGLKPHPEKPDTDMSPFHLSRDVLAFFSSISCFSLPAAGFPWSRCSWPALLICSFKIPSKTWVTFPSCRERNSINLSPVLTVVTPGLQELGICNMSQVLEPTL